MSWSQTDVHGPALPTVGVVNDADLLIVGSSDGMGGFGDRKALASTLKAYAQEGISQTVVAKLFWESYGTWDSATTYLPDHVVYQTGQGGFIALLANTNAPPHLNPDKWQRLTDDFGVSGKAAFTSSPEYYVRTDGNDANTGLANTVGAAFATPQRAFAELDKWDYGTQWQGINFYYPTIYLGPGTWTLATGNFLDLPDLGPAGYAEFYGSSETTTLIAGGNGIRKNGAGSYYCEGFCIKDSALTGWSVGRGSVYFNGRIDNPTAPCVEIFGDGLMEGEFSLLSTAPPPSAVISVRDNGVSGIYYVDCIGSPSLGAILDGQDDSTIFAPDVVGFSAGSKGAISGRSKLVATYFANPDALPGTGTFQLLGADCSAEFSGGYIVYGNSIREFDRLALRPSAVQNITAATQAIIANATNKLISSDANYTMTAAPTIPDGTVDGQKIELFNTGAFTITIQDQGTLAGSNLRLTATGLAIGPRQSVKLAWRTGIGDWVQSEPLVAVL
jgi:hypothetical protein